MAKLKLIGSLLIICLVCAVFVVASGTIETSSGDITLNPAGGDVYVDGDLGVGKSTPSDKLEVNGAIVSWANMVGQTGSFIAIDYYLGAARFYAQGADDTTRGTYAFRIRERDKGNTLEALSIANDGEVGVGTSDPQAKLDVDGAIVPHDDDSHDLGSASLRWDDVYATGEIKSASVGYIVPEGESATNIVASITTKEDGQLDHNSIHGSLKTIEEDHSEEYYQQLYQIEAISQQYQIDNPDDTPPSYDEIASENKFTAYLTDETQDYELISISKLIIAQQQAIKELRNELCSKDDTYSFC